MFPVGLNGFGFESTVDTDVAFDIFDTYRALGGNFIGTDASKEGRSEAVVGRWLHSRWARSSVILAATVASRVDSPGLRHAAIARAVDLSLERLQTDYLDLLLLGPHDAAVLFEETLLAVDGLVRAGKVRYAGAAAHDANRLVEARVIAAMLGVAPLVAAQCDYGLANRQGFEGSVVSVIVDQGLGVLPRVPLSVPTSARRHRRTLAALDPIAGEHHMSPATVAFASLLSTPGVCAPVAAVSTVEQVLDLVASTTVQLTRHQVAAFDRASEYVPRVDGEGRQLWPGLGHNACGNPLQCSRSRDGIARVRSAHGAVAGEHELVGGVAGHRVLRVAEKLGEAAGVPVAMGGHDVPHGVARVGEFRCGVDERATAEARRVDLRHDRVDQSEDGVLGASCGRHDRVESLLGEAVLAPEILEDEPVLRPVVLVEGRLRDGRGANELVDAD